MASYVERDAAIKAAQDSYHVWNLAMATADDKREINFVYTRQELCKAVEQVFKIVPTADVAPVRHGHWVYKHRRRGGFRQRVGVDALGIEHFVTVDERYEVDDPYCSECGKLNDGTFLEFCPNCGATMDGGAGNEV